MTAADSTPDADRTTSPDSITDDGSGDPEVPSDLHHCYRCDGELDAEHWIRLSTDNRGRFAHGFDDVTRPICPDCAAAVGLLEPVIEHRP